ncbi:hypothetical protein [Sphingomonas sp. PAMC 26605]|uniref:hypothetical protein n=1 Tax=Sphingomonas sp. PAMC 26605 TaxID=1112214 RepID=UPI00026CCA4C|nr:hypothetical protein [Sphingomonas sp. PAMC 26605]
MTDHQRHATRAWSKRPLFSPRQKLTAQALNAAVDDQLARHALLTRALHGNGVIFGLAVEVGAGAGLTIGCGLAIDRHGRMLYWEDGILALEDVAGPPVDAAGDYTLVMHYAERRAGQDESWPCATPAEWIEQGVVFTLRPGCTPIERCCPEGAARTEPVSFDAYVCQRSGAHPGPVPRSPDLDWACATPGKLCATQCGWQFDAEAGIDIACVRVRDLRPGDADCGPVWTFEAPVDSCAVRPFVARSPLLMDLLRGCPPQVESFSWHEWTRDYAKPVPWSDFADMFNKDNGLVIEFTKPIRRTTLHPGSIALTVLIRNRDDDYLNVQQIPLDPENPITFLEDPPTAFARRIRLNLYREWRRNQLGGNRGSLFYSGGQVELSIRGQLLRDDCENMLDARLHDATPVDWGNRRVGGDFVAVFRVESGDPPRRRIEHMPDEGPDDKPVAAPDHPNTGE